MNFRTLSAAICLVFSATVAQAASYTEDFNGSFPAWESNWLGTNSNLTNYYGVGAGRGNNPDGLWIGNTDIQFHTAFGHAITSMSFDVASWVTGTINFYDASNNLISNAIFTPNYGALSLPGTYEHVSVASTNGISHFNFIGNGVLGNTSIDNVNVSAVPEPGSYAMLLAGLGLIGFMARRKA